MGSNTMLGISIAHWLVIVSACIGVIGIYPYIKNTIAGTTKPNLVSWSLWAASPLIGAAAAIAGGANIWTTTRIFLAGFFPLLVCIAAFTNKRSHWQVTVFDCLCGVFSIGGLIVWATINSTKLAILFAAIGDGFATLPTIIKAWKYPETETRSTYLAGLVSVLIVIPSIPVWTVENSSFQIYLMICNSLLVLAMYRKSLWPGSKSTERENEKAAGRYTPPPL